MRTGKILLWLLLAGIAPVNATIFYTQRLQSIAKSLGLSGLDSLPEGTNTHQYLYKGHALSIRVNEWGEVCHIGLYLFPQWRRDVDPSSPVYDFLERHLLERQLTTLDEGLRHGLQHSNVYFLEGSAQTAMLIDTTWVNEFVEEHIDKKSYRVTWGHEGKEVLRMTFDMDCQLLTGCNALELEQIYIKEMDRYRMHDYGGLDTGRLPKEGVSCVLTGDTLYVGTMRNDLYFERGDQQSVWQLTNNADKPTQTLANLMLSPLFPDEAKLTLLLEKYTYEQLPKKMAYRRWLMKSIDEGCTPFFGIKEKTDKGYTGTVIMLNKLAGYAHLMSINAATSGKKESQWNITGRIYLYIPLHNVSDNYFKSTKQKRK